ncbi:MAG: class I SAM-dependent methyltransferase [Phycisphaerales bacterium]|nr:class I SAM-dependent methyltransferase [Phycisphaerales bacterium]
MTAARPEESASLKPYRDAMALHGPGFDATLWRKPEAQQLRFAVALEMLPCAGHRVADLGCGVGDLVQTLAGHPSAPSAYLGVDGQPEMVAEAQSRCEQALPFDTSFAVLDMTGDLSQVADWSPEVCVMSGSLNTMAQEEALKVVAAAFEMASIGVVFNFLSDMPDARYHGKDTAPARRFHTTEVLRWCMQQTPLVQFRQDYLDGHDATIAMRHSV